TLAGANLRWGCGGYGHQQHVVVSQRLVQALGVVRLAAERPVDRTGWQHPAEARKRADAPFKALGVSERGGLLVDAAQVDRGELWRRHQRAVVDLALLHVVAEAAQQRNRVVQCGTILWVQLRQRRGRQLARERDLQRAGRLAITGGGRPFPERLGFSHRRLESDLPKRRQERTRRHRVGAGIARTVGDRVVEQRGVAHRAREHAVDNQAVPRAHVWRKRYSPALSLQPEQPAVGGREADRAAAVARERGADKTGGDGGRAAPAGAAGAVLEPPRGVRGAP